MNLALSIVDLRQRSCEDPHMALGMLGFVGRKRELEELRVAAAEARAGRGGVWLLAGEAGSGKSRLAEEFVREAQREGMLAAWGRCWEAGGAPAYWPWVQALRALFREVPAAAQRRETLAQMLPELQEPEDPPHSLSPEQARFQLLDAVGNTLCDLAARQPLVVVLEDLHVADASSLMLLDFLTRQFHCAGVLMLGTLRESDARRSEARDALARLAQEARTLPLGPLAEGDVAELLTNALRTKPDNALIRRAHARTEGNALFVVELARLLVAHEGSTAASTDAVPPTVITTLRQRLNGVSRAARETLELAAVIGRGFLAGQLAEAFACHPGEVRRALEEAEEAALVLSTGPGSYRFSHILIREVLHEEMEPERRQALHLKLARALVARHGDAGNAPWSEVAHHFRLAGEDGRADAVEAGANAAASATDALAFEDAADEYRLALQSLDAGAEADPRQHADLLIGMGQALMHAGKLEEGRKLCKDASDLARSLDDAELLAGAALAFGSVMVFARVDPLLVELLEEAAQAQGAGDSAVRARLLARLASAKQPAPDPAVPIALAHEAIGMARRLADSTALLDTLRTGCSAMMDLEAPERRRPLNREHVELATQLGDQAETFRGLVRLSIDDFDLGDIEAAQKDIEQARSTASALGHPQFLWRAEALEATRALWFGRFAEAEQHIQAAYETGAPSGDPNLNYTNVYQRIRLYRLTGAHDELAALLPDFMQLFSTTPVAAIMRMTASAQLTVVGKSADAARALDSAAAAQAVALGDRTTLEALSELAYAAGDEVLARQLIDRVESSAGQLISSGVIGMTWDGPVHRALSLCYRALDDLDRAFEQIQAAIELCRRLRGEPMWAWCSAEAAEIARQRGRRGDSELAQQHARAAAEAAARLSMAGVLARSRSVVAQLQEPLRASAPPPYQPVFSIELTGEVWTISQGSREFRVKDTKGMRMLARLVADPRREFHALDLSSPDGSVDGGDAGETIDAKARNEYQARLRELEAEIAEAQSWNDHGRAEARIRELEMLQTELARAVGLGGRERRSGSAAERARINVQRRLRDAMRRIEQHDEKLGRHLARAVRTGTYCSYDPA